MFLIHVVLFCLGRYCKVNVKEELLADIYPGPVTLVFERAPILSKDFNPSAPVSRLIQLNKSSRCCWPSIDHYWSNEVDGSCRVRLIKGRD